MKLQTKSTVERTYPKQKKEPRKPNPKNERTRLHMNVGREAGTTTQEVTDVITSNANVPANALGKIEIHARHVLIDVATKDAENIITKVKRKRVRGNRVKIRVA